MGVPVYYERDVRSIAARDGLPMEQVQADLHAEQERLLGRRRELAADPARLESLVQESLARQRSRAVG